MTEDTTTRPELFADKTPIGLHLRVVRVLKTAAGRTFYVADNHEPRWYTRICWACGNKHSPPTAQACTYCTAPLKKQRYLMSTRWDQRVQAIYKQFAAAPVKHSAILAPFVIYRYLEQQLAFYSLDQEALLCDEPGPLGPRTVLKAGHALSRGMGALHQAGWGLAALEPHHILLRKDGSARWFDLDLLPQQPQPIGPDHKIAQANTRALAHLLRTFAPPTHAALCDFLTAIATDPNANRTMLTRGLARLAQGDLGEPIGELAMLSDVGRKRAENQDECGSALAAGKLVVAVTDGMGGHHDGRAAAQLATQTLLQETAEALKAKTDPKVALRKGIVAANAAVYQAGHQSGKASGAAVVAAIIDPDKGDYVLGHLGDCRAYSSAEALGIPLTEDHSMVMAMVVNGKLSREEARKHPKANVLLAFLGNDKSADPEIAAGKLAPGHRLLLCSDGVWGALGDDGLGRLLTRADDPPRRVVRRLVRAANEVDGSDNITALVYQQPAR